MATKLSPLLATMSKAARVAYPFIAKAVSSGLGADEIIAAMREGGIPTFRRQDMLALIREASGAELLKSDIARWPADAVLPISRVRSAVTRIVAPFSYTLKLTIVDADTGELRTILRQAHSKVLEPLGRVAARFLAAAQGISAYDDLEIEDAVVTDVISAGGEGVL